VSDLDPIALGLPHRDPFVFVDAISEHVPGERALGRKCFREDDPIFRGHFPGDPIVPGVILAEALAQTAGIAVGSPGQSLRLSAIRSMKFPSPARPGEVISLTARKAAGMGTLVQCTVEASVAGRVVAEGVIVLSDPRAS
jgi:3-hydroxyacyl-[acyl-carrier-protein] dehydratase